ncbi:MAG: hypothetical protein EOP09_12835 [Proteobacteria bacterium]|nr:MAG: hypothetical protein EOP09_12835 [Pseudomonadota bacterium]
MYKKIGLVAVALSALAIVLPDVSLAASKLSAPPASDPSPSCRVFVSGYKQTKIWRNQDVQVEIDAKEACQEHFLLPMKLKLVQVRVVKDGEVIRRYFGSTAHYSPSSGQLLLTDVLVAASGNAKLPMRTSLVVSLKTGEVRSPQGPQLSIFEGGPSLTEKAGIEPGIESVAEKFSAKKRAVSRTL